MCQRAFLSFHNGFFIIIRSTKEKFGIILNKKIQTKSCFCIHLCVELGQRVHGVLGAKILLHYVFGSVMVSFFFGWRMLLMVAQFVADNNFFFLFSLFFPRNLHCPCKILELSSNLWGFHFGPCFFCFYFFLCFCKNLICFKFHCSILICDMWFFFNLVLIFLIIFLSFLVNWFFFSILSFNQNFIFTFYFNFDPYCFDYFYFFNLFVKLFFFLNSHFVFSNLF